MTRGRAAYGSFPEPSVAAWRDEPAVQGRGRDTADRPDPETIPTLVDARGHQGRVGSSLAAKKADAVVRMSFAPRGSATSLRRRLSSSSVACASCADCAAAAERVAGWPYPQAEESLAAAHAYNERLAASGQPVLGEARDPFSAEAGGSRAAGEDSASAQDEEYQSLLDAGGGVMGAIRIPEISVDLPIYHGTSESALASGAGHLYGSSLPVGGESTHSVITGHRGLVEAMMFTRLDEMKVGDYFYIDVMGETLGYRVDRIEVIEPDDTSKLKIVEGEDRVTLMTCTPYGVNTHRLLVSGVRAAIPGDIPPIEEAPHDPRVAAAIAVSGTLLPLLLLVAFLRRGPWNPMRHGARWPKHW